MSKDLENVVTEVDQFVNELNEKDFVTLTYIRKQRTELEQQADKQEKDIESLLKGIGSFLLYVNNSVIFLF